MSSDHPGHEPPRLAIWLLEHLCSYDYLSTALWDLDELFAHHVDTKGLRRAQWLYLKEALSIVSHLYFKGQSRYALNTSAMLKNNIIIAFRNFKKYKNYTALNILGLSSGLIIFLLITSYTTYEFSYDTYHEKAERIYRVYKSVNGLEDPYLDAGTPGPLAEAMKSDYPEVEAATRIAKWRNQLMVANEHSFVEPAVHMVDPSVFDIFSFELLHGNKEDVLTKGSNIAISETVALKYFDHTDVVNERLLYRGDIPLVITGVFKDMPDNSHFKMDILVNFEWAMNAFEQDLSNWNNNPFYTYVSLQEGVNVKVLEGKLPAIREKYANDPIDEDGQAYTYYLQPLREVHFSANINGSMGNLADANRLYVFTAIAFIVLLMAGINYVNLATARSMVRIKETSIRKIMGARRYNLLGQFLIESGLIVFFSLLLAIVLAGMLIPVFSSFVDRPLVFDLMDPVFWLQIIVLGVLITIASGLYPALLMSSFNPLAALNKTGSFTRTAFVRNALVVLQFALSAILITSAMVLQQQLSFISNVDTGYTREQVMILSTRDDAIDDKLDTYMAEIAAVPGVEAVATSWSLPTNVTSNTQANWPGIEDAERLQMYLLGVTHGFFDLYEIELSAGRIFDPEIQSDQSAIILNEAAVNAFGWKDAVGREMLLQSGEVGRVIGVVKDFHIKSLREEIEPLQIVLNPYYATLAVRISGDLSTTILAIEKVYESFEPSYPFEYRYFEDIYDRAYEDDFKTGQLTLIFSLLAIVIACLGLYGLASHKVAWRIKELGVRKVMGASAFDIVRLLFKDFFVLIGLAFVLAGPVAYFLLSQWLDNYAYHIELGMWPFAITFFTLIVFAALTVGHRTYKASVTSPVLALRDE